MNGSAHPAMATNTVQSAQPRWLVAYAREAQAEVLKLWRQPAFLYPTLAFPALFYLLFGVVMARGPNTGDVARYMLATYAVFGAMGPALFGFGVGLAEERGNGLLDLKRVLPLPPMAYLVAKTLMAMAFALFIGALLLLLAMAVGGVRLPLASIICYFAVLTFGALPFAALGLLIGCLMRAQAATAIVQMIYLPLGFLGGLWFPIFMLPNVLQTIAVFLPSYHFGQLNLWAVGIESIFPWISLLALGAFALVFLALAASAWRRMEM